MKLNAAMLMAALVLSGTVLAQSSGPSAGGEVKGGRGADVTTTGQAPNSNKKTGDSGSTVEQAAKPGAGVNRGHKTDRRLEHYP